jgi:23S rRNA pseudouridine2605 synthase
VWIALNKPRGYVCTRRDPQHRRTVYELLPAEFHALFTVGRLDADSEGLLLLTNDGDAANRLLHPRYGVQREYVADVEGSVAADELRQLVRGVELDDGTAQARDARRISAWQGGTRVRLILAEGRKREVRRMLEAVGHPVKRLRRDRYGPVNLGKLRPGEWRRLPERVIERLGRVREPAASAGLAEDRVEKVQPKRAPSRIRSPRTPRSPR